MSNQRAATPSLANKSVISQTKLIEKFEPKSDLKRNKSYFGLHREEESLGDIGRGLERNKSNHNFRDMKTGIRDTNDNDSQYPWEMRDRSLKQLKSIQ